MKNKSSYSISEDSEVPLSLNSTSFYDQTRIYMKENHRLHRILAETKSNKNSSEKNSRSIITHDKSLDADHYFDFPDYSGFSGKDFLDALITSSHESLDSLIKKCGKIPDNILRAIEMLTQDPTENMSTESKIEYSFALEIIKQKIIKLLLDQNQIENYFQDIILNSEKSSICIDFNNCDDLMYLINKKTSVFISDSNKRKIQDMYTLANELEK